MCKKIKPEISYSKRDCGDGETFGIIYVLTNRIKYHEYYKNALLQSCTDRDYYNNIISSIQMKEDSIQEIMYGYE